MNRILGYVNGTIVANQVRLQAARDDHAFLLVEGDSDSLLLRKYIIPENCTFIPCCGKVNVIDALALLQTDNFDRAIGLVDRDALKAHKGSTPNLLSFTDDNDLEITIIRSPALRDFLREFGSDSKVEAVESIARVPVEDYIFGEASKIGALRELSRIRGWDLRFDGMKYKFCDQASPEIDMKETIKHIVGRIKNKDLPPIDIIIKQAAELIGATENLSSICCGHDCTRILGRALRNKLGNYNGFNSEKSHPEIEKVLRLSYDYEYFKKTSCFTALLRLGSNTGKTIFR